MLNRVYLIVLIFAIATSTVPSTTLDIDDPNQYMIKKVVGGFEVQPHACPWQIAYDNISSFIVVDSFFKNPK